MNYVIVLWIVWAVLGLSLLALLLYRVSITQYEEDQLYLDGANDVQQERQNAMMAKLRSVKPAIQILGGVEGLITLTIAAMYVVDALRQF